MSINTDLEGIGHPNWIQLTLKEPTVTINIEYRSNRNRDDTAEVFQHLDGATLEKWTIQKMIKNIRKRNRWNVKINEETPHTSLWRLQSILLENDTYSYLKTVNSSVVLLPWNGRDGSYHEGVTHCTSYKHVQSSAMNLTISYDIISKIYEGASSFQLSCVGLLTLFSPRHLTCVSAEYYLLSEAAEEGVVAI